MNPESSLVFYDVNNGASLAEIAISRGFPVIPIFGDQACQGGGSMDATMLLRLYNLDSSYTGILPMNMSPGSMTVLQQADVEVSTQSTTQQGLHALNQRLRVNDNDSRISDFALPQYGKVGQHREVR